MSAIESFVAAHLRLAPGKTVKTSSLMFAYTSFNGGTKGKMKLYAHIKSMEGVKKERQTFSGVELVGFSPAPCCITTPENVVSTIPTFSFGDKSPETIRLEIEMRRIAIEERRAALEITKAEDAKEEKKRRDALEATKAERQAALEATKAERQAALETMKTNIAKEIEDAKVKSAEKLKAMDEASAEKLKAMDEASAEKLKAMDEAAAKNLKAMDLEWEKEKAERLEASQIRDREFWAEQNNKNRKMYDDNDRWNKHLDMRVYGTPSKQYITSDSIFDNFDFRVFDAIGKVDTSARKLIREKISSAAKTVPVWEREAARSFEVADVDRVTDIIDEVMEQIEVSREKLRESFAPIQALLSTIPEMALRDNRRFLGTSYERSSAAQDPDKFTSMKSDKRAYLREANEAYMKGGDTRLKCYCCRKDISIKSSACHRSHNIPRSLGGDWSTDNIYLCCATCNSDMDNKYTVLEYKALLFQRELLAIAEVIHETVISSRTIDRKIGSSLE